MIVFIPISFSLSSENKKVRHRGTNVRISTGFYPTTLLLARGVVVLWFVGKFKRKERAGPSSVSSSNDVEKCLPIVSSYMFCLSATPSTLVFEPAEALAAYL
jgi:hypothetical protein